MGFRRLSIKTKIKGNVMTTQLSTYRDLLVAVTNEINSYEERPTKTGSARIRKLSLQLGKNGAPLRNHMIKLDKAK